MTGRDIRGRLDSEMLRAAFDYWVGLPSYAGLPRWSSFDHTRIDELLPYVVLMGVRQDTLDFRFLIIGTNILAHFATDYTGQWLSEITHKSDPSMLYKNLSRAVIERRAVVGDTPYVGPKKEHKVNKEMILPLTDQTGEVSRLVVAIDFVWS